MESVLPVICTCHECGANFENYDLLMNHKQSQQECKCDQCAKIFSNSCQLFLHKRQECENIHVIQDEQKIGAKFINVNEEKRSDPVDSNLDSLENKNFVDENLAAVKRENIKFSDKVSIKSKEVINGDLYFDTKEIKSDIGLIENDDTKIPEELEVEKRKKVGGRIGGRKKKKSIQQLVILKQKFEENAYPSMSTVTDLSKETGLSEKAIKIWFNNTKMKQKKEKSADEKNIEEPNFQFRVKKTKNQVDMLEQKFAETTHPSKDEFAFLSLFTGLAVKVIKIWFVNKRGELRMKGENIIRVRQQNKAAFGTKNKEETLVDTGYNEEGPDESPIDTRNILDKLFAEDVDAGDSQRSFEDSSFPLRKKKSKVQKNMLKRAFSENKHPNRFEMQDLSLATGLSFKAIKIWFMNNRNLLVRKSKEKPYENESDKDGLDILSGNKNNMINKNKSNRTGYRYNSYQRGLMVNFFTKSGGQYPGKIDYIELTKSTQLSKHQIRSWFRNKRIKTRKNRQHKFEQENKEIFNESENQIDDKSSTGSSYIIVPLEKREILENYFLQHQYPSTSDYEKLCMLTGLTYSRLGKWFANKRRSVRNKEEAKESLIMNENDKEEYQISLLEKAFDLNQYLDSSKLQGLAFTTKLPIPIIKAWFLNRRANSLVAENDNAKDDKSIDLSVTQETILENSFKMNPYPNYVELGRFTGLSRDIIDQWFNNKRRKIETNQEHDEHKEELIMANNKYFEEMQVNSSITEGGEDTNGGVDIEDIQSNFAVAQKGEDIEMETMDIVALDSLASNSDSKTTNWKKPKKWKGRFGCGECEPCMSQNCRECVNCKNKSRKRKCAQRICVKIQEIKREVEVEVQEESKEEISRALEESKTAHEEETKKDMKGTQEKPDKELKRILEELRRRQVEPKQVLRKTKEKSEECRGRYKNICRRAKEEVRQTREKVNKSERINRKEHTFLETNRKQDEQIELLEKALENNTKEDEQIKLLENAFKVNPDPNSIELDGLVKTTQLSVSVIKTWFLNKKCTQLLANLKTDIIPTKPAPPKRGLPVGLMVNSINLST